jgi:hypothetical protein
MSTENSLRIGEIPESGRYTVKAWSEKVFDCSEACVNQWVEKYKIPYKELPGRNRVIDARDMWDRAPWFNQSE